MAAASIVLSPTMPALPLTSNIYPSSPILSFPPPAPNASRSLRERSGLKLRIKTNFGSSDGTTRSPGRLHIQPHRNNLPRRRATNKRRAFHLLPDLEPEKEEVREEKLPIIEESTPLEDMPSYQEVQVEVPLRGSPAREILGIKTEDSNHLQEIIPGLYVAFNDADPDAEQPVLAEDKPWTHVVNITYPAESDEELPAHGSSRQWYKDGAQRLHLVLPPATRNLPLNARPGLGLTDAHLRVVRDFIAQALPRDVAEIPNQSTIRVLVTAPHGRPTDAMCAAGVYLSFASGQEVEVILRFIDEEEDFLSIWKGEVSGDEQERVQKIASSWSWLNQIQPRPVS